MPPDGDKPWDAHGRQRLDAEPHRARLVYGLGLLSFFCGILAFCTGVTGLLGLPTGLVAWRMALRDVVLMQAGHMDRRGQRRTRHGGDAGLFGALLSLFGTAVWTTLALNRLFPP